MSILDEKYLRKFVSSFLARREEFLDICKHHGSPFYVIEKEVLRKRAIEFVSAFGAVLPGCGVYYALKCNHHPDIVRSLIEQGLGMEVSSGWELGLALKCGSTDIVFTGPGKSDRELSEAIGHADKVTVLLDSFGELDRLEKAAGDAGTIMNAGVRLTGVDSGLWRKFGIPLDDLSKFLKRAAGCRFVRLKGVQFHVSWNHTPENQTRFIYSLAAALGKLPADLLTEIEFVDVGGGFWPPQGEWLLAAGTSENRIRDDIRPLGEPSLQHHRVPGVPIDEFARQLAETVRKEILPLVSCRIVCEPGRWLVNDAMHLMVEVIDKKTGDMAITDAGRNAIGWERFDVEYLPIINLSRPALEERRCCIMGSLCLPQDIWGHSYFGDAIEAGDVLLFPNQGAYTYSMRQNFIKRPPDVVTLDENGMTETMPRQN